MGTYTTNYNLFMPTVGETGWGTLVNGNFTTIDTTMKGLDTRIKSLENEVNGALSCTSVTATTGTFSGAVTGATFNGVTIDSTVINNARINRYALGYTMKYQSSMNPRIGVRLDGGTSANGGNADSPNCIYMIYTVNGSGNFTQNMYLNQLILAGDTDVPYYITSIEGNYTYAMGANCKNGIYLQNSETLKVVCNGKTYTASAGGTTNLTLAQVNELLKYRSTVTITTSSTYAHSGFIFIYPTTQNLYRSIGMY